MKHPVLDTDKNFVVDPITRALTNESKKITLIQGDHNSERFGFEIPRYIEGHDMTLCDKVEVHYINIDANTKERSADCYKVTDMRESPSDKNKALCTWLISGNATKYVGPLNFVLRFVCLNGTTVVYSWSTAVYTAVNISNGINNGEAVLENYTDVLEAWKAEIEAKLENIPTVDLSSLEDKVDEVNAETAKMKKRIEQLEGLTLKKITDSTEAYEKVVPVGVGKNAVINKVGGGLSSKNLCPVDVKASYAMEDEIWSITLDLGTYPAGRYYIRCFDDLQGEYERTLNSHNSFQREYNFTLEEESNVSVDIVSSNQVYQESMPEGFIHGTVDGVMICDASNGDLSNVPYEPYRTLTKPKSIESFGAQLLDMACPESLPSDTTSTNTTKRIFEPNTCIVGITRNNYYKPNQVTLVSRTDSSFTLTSISAGYGLAFALKLKPNTKYTASCESTSARSTIGYGFYDSDGNYLTSKYKESNTFTFTTDDYGNVLLIFSSSAIETFTVSNIMLNRGTEVAPCKPFRAEPIATFTIPAIIRNREGYGLSGSYIDFDRKVWVDADGNETDVSADLQYDDDFLFIEVEPGGSIKFVNEEGTEAPVPSTVTYITKA